MSSRWRIFFTTAAAVLALDQLTKLWIVKNLTLTSEIPVISGFFSIVSVRNRGAAFGFLNRSDIDWQFWLFLAATLVAAWAIIMLVRKSGRAPLLWTGLALVMGGAIGNLVDPPATMINSAGDYVVSYIVSRFVEGKDWLQKQLNNA